MYWIADPSGGTKVGTWEQKNAGMEPIDDLVKIGENPMIRTTRVPSEEARKTGDTGKTAGPAEFRAVMFALTKSAGNASIGHDVLIARNG